MVQKNKCFHAFRTANRGEKRADNCRPTRVWLVERCMMRIVELVESMGRMGEFHAAITAAATPDGRTTNARSEGDKRLASLAGVARSRCRTASTITI